MKKKITLSLVVPAFNEEKIIKKNLQKIINFLSDQEYSWEIVVVDDGSKDFGKIVCAAWEVNPLKPQVKSFIFVPVAIFESKV